MKKLGFLFLLSTLFLNNAMATRSPVVNLPGGGNVLPTSSISIPVSGLMASAVYSIICYIDTTDSLEIVRFGSTLNSTSSSITSYALNGAILTQGQLNIGHNVTEIIGSFAAPNTETINFTNLDQTNSFNVNGCFAMPVIG